MKNILEKLFGGIRLTWKKLILFSIAVGILVGLFNVIPFLAGTSFQDFAVVLDIWFILAIFVIMNSQTRLDAVLKTFIFFLISQPLIYLVTSLFTGTDFTFLLNQYYFRWYDGWFFWTFATIPGAAIAYEIKKSNILSGLVLSVATGALAFFGSSTLIHSILDTFPYHLFAALLDLFFAFAFIFIILKKKSPRILALILTSCALLTGVLYYYDTYHNAQRGCYEQYYYDEETGETIFNGILCVD